MLSVECSSNHYTPQAPGSRQHHYEVSWSAPAGAVQTICQTLFEDPTHRISQKSYLIVDVGRQRTANMDVPFLIIFDGLQGK